MSDLLSGLRTFFLGDDGLMHEVTSAQSGRYAPVGPWLLGSDVREALRNPTDEQARAVAEQACLTLGTWVTAHEVRAVLAAAAGGDNEA